MPKFRGFGPVILRRARGRATQVRALPSSSLWMLPLIKSTAARSAILSKQT